MIEEYSLAPDTGGAGKYRGGLALNRSYRLTGADEAMIQLRSDRQDFLPYGLAGGKPGTPSKNILSQRNKTTEVPPKERVYFNRGDVFHTTTAGTGGWGPPVERDPDAVLNDVQNGKLTIGSAESEYGVVINTDSMELDLAATLDVRRKMSRGKE